MAFNNRTAEENFVSALPSKVADLFFNDYYEKLKNDFDFLNEMFPFHLNPQAKEYIGERGIRLSPFASQTHPHPISKIFENHFLFNVLPRFVHSGSHVAVFSMKQSKADYLYFRAKSFDLKLVNRFLTPTDYGRYDNLTTLNGGRSNFSSFVHNVASVFRKRTPDLIFFHDELMHWKLSDFIYFLARVKPENLAFTFVFPVELLRGVKKSCNSLAYDFEVIENDLFFFPDKSKQNPYIHKDAQSWPFDLNQINLTISGEKISFNLDLVESHGAHHFFILKKNCQVVQPRRLFRDFDCIDFQDKHICNIVPAFNGIIRVKIISKVLSYFVCLMKKNVESALGKLRQLTEGRLLEDELVLINDLAEVLKKYSISGGASPDFWSWINPLNLRDNLRLQSRFLDFFFGDNPTVVSQNLRQLSKSLKPFSVEVPCRSIDFNFDCPVSSSPLSPRDFFKVNDLFFSRLGKEVPERFLIESLDVGTPICMLSSEDDDYPSSVDSDPDERESIPNEEIIDLANNSSNQNNGNGEVLVEYNAWTNVKKNGCFLNAVCSTVGSNPFDIEAEIMKADSDIPNLISAKKKLFDDQPLLLAEMEAICQVVNWRVWIYLRDDIQKLNDSDDLRPISIGGYNGHVFKIKDFSFFECSGLIERAYLDLFGLRPAFLTYRPCLIRAKHLLESFLTMHSGLIIDKRKVMDGKVIDKSLVEHLRSNVFKEVDFKVNILPFLGFAGSGKTRSLFEMIKSHFLQIPFLWISPRAKVLNELKDKVVAAYGNLESAPNLNCFLTFEKALLLPSLPELIIIDESPLLPHGFLDLLLLKKGVSCKTSIALIGDPLQCSFHSQDSILLNKNQSSDFSNIMHLRQSSGIMTDYLFQSFRFGSHSLLPFVQTRDGELEIKLKEKPSEDVDAILVASQSDKRKLGGDLDSRVMTIGESQGCNFRRVSLALTNDLNLSDVRTIVTGLTRSSEYLELVTSKAEADFFMSYKKGSNFCAIILSKNSEELKRECESLIRNLNIVKFTRAGADFEVKLAGDPFLKSMLYMINEDPIEEIELHEVEVEEAIPKTHLALTEPCPFASDFFDKFKAREHREFFCKDFGMSSQFEDTLTSLAQNPNWSEVYNPQTVFPRHRADDQVTFWAAVKKRLFFSDPGTQLRKFQSVKELGRDMLRVFLKKIPLSQTIDQNLMEEAILEFEEKKVSKSEAMIANHAIRSDTDWNENEIFLFMKSQLCKKKEKMFSDAKAGQTLACFAHSVLVKFSGISRYIEKKLSKSLPKRFYIHQKKDFVTFEEWVKQNDFTGVCTESDYEAFDASQDHLALAFEVSLMEYLGFTQNVIEDYIFIKTNLRCKIGTFAIMRFTGEFCTFLFNTMVNMVFTFMKYDIPDDVSICFAGDDMCANRRLKPSTEFNHILDLMSLKAKVDYTLHPTFCGWKIGLDGIVKDPILVYARLEHAIYKNELHLVIDSYFLEFAFAYKKKETLFDFLSEREMDYHYVLTRFFVRNSNLLKGSARDILHSSIEKDKFFFGEGFGNEESMNGYDHGINLFLKKTLSANKDPPFCSPVLDKQFLKNQGLLPSIEKIKDFNLRKGLFQTKILSRDLNFLDLTRNELGASFSTSQSIIDSDAYLVSRGRKSFMNNVRAVGNFFTSGIDKVVDFGFSQKEVFDSFRLKSHEEIDRKESFDQFAIVLKENLSCPSLMSKSSLNLPVVLSRKSSLMEWQNQKFTRILEFSSQKLPMSSSVFKITSLCQSIQNQELSVSMSLCLIKPRLTTLASSLMNTACYIFRLFFSQSPDFSLQLRKLKEGCSSLMPEVQNLAPLLKKVSALICKSTQELITCTVPIIWCPFLMEVYKKALKSGLNSLEYILRLVLTPSSSILGSCTDCSITLMMALSKAMFKMKDFKNYKLVTGFPISIMRLPFLSLELMRITVWKTLVIASFFSKRRVLWVFKEGLKGVSEGTKQIQSLTNLGQVTLKLIINWTNSSGQILLDLLRKIAQGFLSVPLGNSFTTRMSAPDLLNEMVHSQLKEYLFRNIVDPNNQLGLQAAQGTQLTADQEARKNLIMTHYLKNLFGNIAKTSASDKTSFLDMEITLPALPGIPVGQEQNYVITHNLRTSVGAIKAWRDNHNNQVIRNLTFRAVCEPFAVYAMDFLIENPDVRTNLFWTRPYDFGKAPEVCFDFNKGIPIQRIQNNRDRLYVISQLNSRTFNHENKKGVFEAQGAVNFTFDG
uniref:Polyprotein n=1 Tax=Suaeda fruticosa betaflexivirus 1 TaxID=2794407 RepID=A0A7T5UFU9_9VIRU|nr:polyprotein [Suaeda fruticosa betaflexivirus 1]